MLSHKVPSSKKFVGLAKCFKRRDMDLIGGPPSIDLSIYLSISPSSFVCVLCEADKSEESITFYSERNSQQSTTGLESLVFFQFQRGLKMAITWRLRGARPLILAWGGFFLYWILLMVVLNLKMRSLCIYCHTLFPKIFSVSSFYNSSDGFVV